MIFHAFRKTLFLFFIGALVGCTSPLTKDLDLGEPASIFAAPQPAKKVEGIGLTLTAAPLKQNVELGEPIYLAVRLTNTHRDSIKIIGKLRPEDGFIEVFAKTPDGRTVLLSPFSEGDFGGHFNLAPGERIGDVFPIFFGSNGWYFDTPGEYHIYAQLEVPGQQDRSVYESEAVRLSVRDTDSGKALFETDQRTRIEAGKFLVWRGGDHLIKGQNHLKSIWKRYPDSALSSYIGSAFAKSYSEPFADYRTGKVRPPNCAAANELRREQGDMMLPDNLRIDDAMVRAKCFAEQRRWQDAKDALDAAYQLANKGPEFGSLVRAVTEMQERLKNTLEERGL